MGMRWFLAVVMCWVLKVRCICCPLLSFLKRCISHHTKSLHFFCGNGILLTTINIKILCLCSYLL
jgi:hypothetical protein